MNSISMKLFQTNNTVTNALSECYSFSLKMMIAVLILSNPFAGESFGFDGESNEHINEHELAKVRDQYFRREVDKYKKEKAEAEIAIKEKNQKVRKGLKNKKWTTLSGKIVIGLWESTQEFSDRYSRNRHYEIRVNGQMDGKRGKYDIDVRRLSQSCREYVECAFRNNKYNDKDETERRLQEANRMASMKLESDWSYINRLAQEKYFELRDAKRVENGWRMYDGKLRSPEDISRLEEKKLEEEREKKEREELAEREKRKREELISKGWHYENGKMYSPEEWRERDFEAQARDLISRNSISGKVYYRVVKAFDDGLFCIRRILAYTDAYGDWHPERIGEPFISIDANARTVADDECYHFDQCYWCGNYSVTDKRGVPTTLRMYTKDYNLAVKKVRASCKLYVAGDKRFDKKERPKPAEGYAAATGTGFFVAKDILVTCYHVVDGAETVKCNYRGNEYQCSIVAVDKKCDIAILRVEKIGEHTTLPIDRRNCAISDKVFTVGYPMTAMLGKECKYSEGVISALSGLGGDNSCYQVSVPIQPGNSGGPLIHGLRGVVGIISAKLDDAATMAIAGTIPQGVNYAVKSRYLSDLLSDNGISVEANAGNQINAEYAKNATALIKVHCTNKEE